MKAKPTKTRKSYVRPAMRTVVTPKEIRDIDQPCAFYTRRGTSRRGGKK